MARATRERRTPRRRLSILAASGLVAVLATIATVAYAATPVVVLDDPGVQENTSSASDGYLVWSAKSKASPNRSHSYVMAGAGSPVRIDPPGGQSYSAAIDGTTIVYQEWGNDDLGFFDAVTEVRTDPPAGVNTSNSEGRPSLSGDWLLFTRSNSNRVSRRDVWTSVVLFNVSTSARIVLQKKIPNRSTYVVSDQVNGDWATFESCDSPGRSSATVRSIATRSRQTTSCRSRTQGLSSSMRAPCPVTARSTSCAPATAITGSAGTTRGSSDTRWAVREWSSRRSPTAGMP